MKDELNLFYQIWDIPTQTLGNAASVSNLGFFTKFDLFLAKIIKNPMYTTLYVVALLLLLLWRKEVNNLSNYQKYLILFFRV